MLLTWINAKGFSLLLIRAASCWSSSSTIAENMTGAITGEVAGDAADQGLQKKQNNQHYEATSRSAQHTVKKFQNLSHYQTHL